MTDVDLWIRIYVLKPHGFWGCQKIPLDLQRTLSVLRFLERRCRCSTPDLVSCMGSIPDPWSNIPSDTQANTGLKKRSALVITVESFFEGTDLLLQKSGMVGFLSWASASLSSIVWTDSGSPRDVQRSINRSWRRSNVFLWKPGWMRRR